MPVKARADLLGHSRKPPPSADNPSKWYEPLCQGKCAATILIGRQLNTGLAAVFGKSTFVSSENYQYGNSYFVGGAISRSFLEFGRLFALEIEVGVGQRLGSLHESEAWIALYGRWKYFPWNDYLRTTIAVSTGLNYASGVTPYEAGESVDGKGTRLLHYFSPEFTFALPKNPDRELVIRFHHRSGGGADFGNNFLAYGSLFRGAQGGMQYLTIGLRQHF